MFESIQKQGHGTARLEGISHLFLSEERTKDKAPHTSLVTIPLLLDGADQGWLAHDLCHALQERGYPTMILHIETKEEENRKSGELSSQPQRLAHLLQKTAKLQPATRFCLVPLTHAEPDLLGSLERLLLPVPATSNGIQRAYERIQQLIQHHVPAIGITMVGAMDRYSARDSYRKLAVSAMRSLHQTLHYHGYVDAQDNQSDQTADTASAVELVLHHWMKQIDAISAVN